MFYVQLDDIKIINPGKQFQMTGKESQYDVGKATLLAYNRGRHDQKH